MPPEQRSWPEEWSKFQWRARQSIRTPLGAKIFGKPVGAGTKPRYSEDNPAQPDVLGDFLLYVTIKAWNEEDVIEATVRNALVQGAQRVFVIDNGSEDETVARAERAGAVIAERADSDYFDDDLLVALVNGVVARESLASGADHVWWLHLDCDEFPEGPGGTTVREFLGTLDRRFRVAGSRVLNHLPAPRVGAGAAEPLGGGVGDGTGNGPAYIPGFHPLDFMPVCYEQRAGENGCTQRHYKHPLQRFDRDRMFVSTGVGAHYALSSDTAVARDPSEGIVLHHFQYRELVRTRAALERLAGPASARSRHLEERTVNNAKERLRNLDNVYAGRWDEVPIDPRAEATLASLHPAPWPTEPRRWYAPADLEAARRREAAGKGPAGGGGEPSERSGARTGSSVSWEPQ